MLFPADQTIQPALKILGWRQKGDTLQTSSVLKGLWTLAHTTETGPAQQRLPIVSGSADYGPQCSLFLPEKKKRKGDSGSQTLVTSTLRYLVAWRKEEEQEQVREDRK